MAIERTSEDRRRFTEDMARIAGHLTLDEAIRICYPDVDIPDTTPIVRGAVEELLLTLDRGLSQIETAGTLEEAQKTAAGIREALREGWPS